jgi:poly(hydroxyalkanoate) depolymerase family esterase
MNDRMRAGMAEATRLTRAGRLAEATALIQRMLGIAHISDPFGEEPESATTTVEAEHHTVSDSIPSSETLAGDMSPDRKIGTPIESATSRPAAGLGVLSPDALRLPGSMRSILGQRSSLTPEEVPLSVRAGGQFVDGTYTNTAGTRAYKLYIPSGYTGQALPLLIMLHGCTQTSVDFAAGTRMNVFAERDLFLVAYPEQANSANGSKCWNWFQSADQHRGTGEPSLIAGMTQQIMSEYHSDASRVYVAGLSAGGAMATIMAATYPDLYAAVGVHSGLPYGSAQDLPSAFMAMMQGAPQQVQRPSRIIPMIMFHGDGDTTVAPVNADQVLDQWLQAAEDTPGAARRPALDVKGEEGRAVGKHPYTRFIYQDASGRAIVEKWIVHQAGHAWSGGSPNGSFTDPKGPDASAEMVRFFSEHPKGRL